jgi:hypothetical protein
MGKFLLIIVAALAAYIAFNWREIAEDRAQSMATAKAQREAERQPIVILTTPDGCKVYRFIDGGYNRYFTRCAAETTTEYRVPSGKSSRPESITTENTR